MVFKAIRVFRWQKHIKRKVLTSSRRFAIRFKYLLLVSEVLNNSCTLSHEKIMTSLKPILQANCLRKYLISVVRAFRWDQRQRMTKYNTLSFQKGFKSKCQIGDRGGSCCPKVYRQRATFKFVITKFQGNLTLDPSLKLVFKTLTMFLLKVWLYVIITVLVVPVTSLKRVDPISELIR